MYYIFIDIVIVFCSNTFSIYSRFIRRLLKNISSAIITGEPNGNVIGASCVIGSQDPFGINDVICNQNYCFGCAFKKQVKKENNVEKLN